MWVNHNSGISDFTIPLNTDLSLIGEYIITIKSEIMIPTDYLNSVFTTMAVEYPFSIFVEPCIITDFSMIPISKLEYTIGAVTVISEQYLFIQTPSCNYPVILTVTDLPVFTIHDELQ